jgi:hypothetical protein
MISAKATFDSSIKDASDLLDLFEEIHSVAPPANPVLKRAALIVAFTAWETYVEDRVLEVVQARLATEPPTFNGQFVERRLQIELKQFNNPNTEKTVKLFKDFVGVDVSQAWFWNNYDTDRVKADLDSLIAKRGDAVHRSRSALEGHSPPHLIKKTELETAIRFLKALVDATEMATSPPVYRIDEIQVHSAKETPGALATWLPPTYGLGSAEG